MHEKVNIKFVSGDTCLEVPELHSGDGGDPDEHGVPPVDGLHSEPGRELRGGRHVREGRRGHGGRLGLLEVARPLERRLVVTYNNGEIAPSVKQRFSVYFLSTSFIIA